MNLSRLAPAAIAVALVALPAAAFAAPDQNSGPYNNNNNNQCVQWNNNGQCVRWNNNGQWNNNGRGDRDHNDRDDHRDRNGRNGNNGYGNNGYGNGQLDAVVGSFSPYNLYLQNGQHVSLHNGTVINPTGATLQGGQRVQVYGHWNGSDFIADQINILGRSWR